MKRTTLLIIIALALLLAACISSSPISNPDMDMGNGMGGGMGMMQEDHASMPGHDQMEQQVMGMIGQEYMLAMRSRHNTPVPEEYAGLFSSIEPDQASLDRGQELYNSYCLACHGESGLGDGSAASALTPRPAPIGMSSQMVPEDYWFWRVSEGGFVFETAMPAWKGVISDEDIWNLLNYVRTLQD